MTDADEQGLIEAAQRDPARFGELYDRHFHRIYAYVVRRVENRTVAEDLTAQVFHEALANLGRFEWRGIPFAGWLFRIATNAINDHWARCQREAGTPAPPSTAVARDDIERHALLFQLVERLPDAQRQVIEMRFVEQRSIRDVADALGRSDGAVKQLQLRALNALRAAWEDPR